MSYVVLTLLPLRILAMHHPDAFERAARRLAWSLFGGLAAVAGAILLGLYLWGGRGG